MREADITKIEAMIYNIRGQRVMMDFDLAELYGVETKTLKRAVRRNLNRFPQDFMFEMSEEELKLEVPIWHLQFYKNGASSTTIRFY